MFVSVLYSNLDKKKIGAVMKRLLTIITILVVIISCASIGPVRVKNITPLNKNLIFTSSGKSISLNVESEIDADKYGITSNDFRKALISSIEHSKLFSIDSTSNSGEYKLDATIKYCRWSASGFAAVTDFLILYEITNNRNDEVLYKKLIRSTDAAEPSEAFVGLERQRISEERAIKKNLQKFIWNISKLEIK